MKLLRNNPSRSTAGTRPYGVDADSRPARARLVAQARLAAGIVAIVAASIAGGALLGSSLLAEDTADVVAANARPVPVRASDAAPSASVTAPQEAEASLSPRLAARLPAPSPSSGSPAEVSDARWAREVVAAPNVVPALADHIAELQAFAASRGGPGEEADNTAEPDPERTAAVPSPTAVDPQTEAPAAEPSGQQSSRPVTGTGTISTAVNLRAGPAKNAAVLGTVGAGQRVEIVACDIWCEIVHDGRRGFVFAEFVRQAAAASGGAAATPAAAAAAAPAGEATAAPAEAAPAVSKPAITPPGLIRDENRGR